MAIAFLYGVGGKSGVQPTGTINITENGTVDVTNYASAEVNVSEQPTLNAVSITQNGDNLSITNPASNGNFVSGYKIYEGADLIYTTSLTLFNLMSLDVGAHAITVKAAGTNFKDSPASNEVSVSIYSITRSLTHLSSSNIATKILSGTDYTTTLSADSGWYLPETITVTVGGLPATFSYDAGSGAITILAADVTGNIVITASASDVAPVVIDPVFANNDWAMIAQVFKSGNAANYWSVGDTKPVTLTNGETYTIRIVDMHTGSYNYSNGNGASNGVFEFVEIIKNAQMNDAGEGNSGGWAQCYMKNTVMPDIYAMLPSDLQSAISEVNVLSGTGGGLTSGTSSSANKLFLPCGYEISGRSSESFSGEAGTGTTGTGAWLRYTYYQTHNTDADRIKKNLNDVAASWWLRSPRKSYANTYVSVKSTGAVVAEGYSNYSIGVSPVFTI